MKIFGMGGFELVIILIVILIIFGPKNLPKLGKALGNTVSNLREGMNAGKKKDEKKDGEEQDDAKPADEEAASVAATAEIEGEVVEFNDEVAAPSHDEADEADAPVPETDEPAGEAPKKVVVKRVVKKKADNSDQVDSE